MKLIIASVVAGSAAAFTTNTPSTKTSTAMNAFSFVGKKKAAAVVAAPSFTIENIPGALEPMGLFDPLDFASKTDEEGFQLLKGFNMPFSN